MKSKAKTRSSILQQKLSKCQQKEKTFSIYQVLDKMYSTLKSRICLTAP